jgi:urea carboxylase-associated protein 2
MGTTAPTPPTTATPLGAREHARAQAGTVVEAMPLLPASRYPDPPAGVAREDLTWAETVAAGGYTTKVLSRGTTLRLTDLRGEACAHLLLYHADQPWERLNVADTVKVPWQAYLTAGHPLLSDQGRALATLIADTAPQGHDALAGPSTLRSNEARYGAGTAHSPTPAVRELFKLAAAKHDLTVRDLAPSVSFFKGVRVAEDGELEFHPEAEPGGYVELRAELALIVLLVNAPHRLDERPGYPCTPLEVLAWRGEPTGREDPLWSSTPELARALENTEDHCRGRGLA